MARSLTSHPSSVMKVSNMADRNELKLLEIHELPGNNICADCRAIGTEWASHNIGIFICTRCAGIHRGLGVHISKVKNLKLDRWDAAQVARMEEVGNDKANEKYEAFVPVSFRTPNEHDPHVLLEQWIRSKYLREEFINDEPLSYLSGNLEGMLMKKRKWDAKYFPRKFILSQIEGVVSYYVGQKKVPKTVLRLAELNVVLSPEKLGAAASMQLTYLQDGTTRHLYLKQDDSQTVVNWYQAIRAAKLHRLQVAFPAATTRELMPLLTTDFAMEGWLSKTGPRRRDSYRRRWFTLDGRKLMYHEQPLDPYPKGEIFLGHMLGGYSVREGVPPGIKDIGFPFTLRTPARTFHLSSQREEDRDTWIQAIQSVLSTTPTPQDNALAGRLVRKRNQHSISIFSSR